VAAAVIVGILGWTLYDAQLQLGTQRVVNEQLTEELAQARVLTTLIAHTDTDVAALASPQPITPAAAGWIVWSPSKQRGFMVVHFLPPLPVGHTYQLWAIADQQALSATVFQVDTVGHAALFELLHATLALARRPMGALTPVVEIGALALFHSGENVALGGPVATADTMERVPVLS
jgi:hypothetical protein